jgi:hypothetical protein
MIAQPFGVCVTALCLSAALVLSCPKKIRAELAHTPRAGLSATVRQN